MKTKIECGVPREQALIEAGYDPTIVKDWFTNTPAEEDTNQPALPIE